MTRREFLRDAATAGAGLLVMVGCGDDADPATPDASPMGDGSPTPPTPDGGGTSDGSTSPPPGDGGGGEACPRVTARIQTNHGHLLMIPADDLRAGVEATYDIQAMGDHSHSVTLTAEHFAALGRTEEVMVESAAGNAHTHMISIRCAPRT